MNKILAFFYTLLLIWTAGCQSQKNLTANESIHTLTLGLSADYPPFEFRKNGQIVGMDIDIASEITKRLGYQLQVQDMEFSSLIPALQSGQIDFILSGMSVSEERKKNVDFTDTYYINSFVLMSKSGTNFLNESALSNKVIGAQLGTTMEKMGKQKEKSIPGMKIVPLGKNEILVEELKANRIDALIMEKVQALAFAKAHPTLQVIQIPEWKKISTEGIAIAFRKNASLKNPFTEILNKMKKDGSLKTIIKNWVGQNL